MPAALYTNGIALVARLLTKYGFELSVFAETTAQNVLSDIPPVDGAAVTCLALQTTFDAATAPPEYHVNNTRAYLVNRAFSVGERVELESTRKGRVNWVSNMVPDGSTHIYSKIIVEFSE